MIFIIIFWGHVFLFMDMSWIFSERCDAYFDNLMDITYTSVVAI